MVDTYRVTWEDGFWKVLKEGAKRALRRFDTRQEAVDFAGGTARKHAPSTLFLETSNSPVILKYSLP